MSTPTSAQRIRIDCLSLALGSYNSLTKTDVSTEEILNRAGEFTRFVENRGESQ